MSVNLLNLPDWEVIRVQETRDAYRIHARYTKPPAYCPSCAVSEPGVQRFGKRENAFADLPHHGKRTEIVVDRQRYRCRECGSTFLEPLPHMDEHHDATRRMVGWVEQQALRRPFSQVARDVELSESTVRRIFTAFVDREDRRYVPMAPTWLGIDEVYLLGEPRAVLTCLKRRFVIDMLPGRSLVQMTNYLKHLRCNFLTEVVAIDMWRPYRDAVRATMPKAAVVVDKFHVVRTATSGLEAVRKSIRKGLNSRQRVQLKNDRFLLLKRGSKLAPNQRLILDAWGGAFPDLHRAWELKESFYAIYDAETKAEARERMRAWIPTVPARFRTKEMFRPSITALENWEEEILAYWDHPATNAYTESLNNSVRTVERAGRGYSFEMLRAKVVHAPPKWADGPKGDALVRGKTPDWIGFLPPGWKIVRNGALWGLTAANPKLALHA